MRENFRGVGKIVAFALFVLVLAAVLLFVLNRLAAGDDERSQQQAEIAALQSGLDEANSRLVDEGAPPVDVPSVEPGEDPQEPVVIQGIQGIPGVQGIQGRTGPPGEIGPPGPVGKPGKDGSNGDVGATGATGLPGADGRGIQSMQCATGGWAIEYTNGFTDTDGGPCQGPQGVHGEQGPASTVPGPTGDTGPQGTAKPGTYTCPDGEVMTGFTVADDGAVTLACEDTTPPIIETP